MCSIASSITLQSTALRRQDLTVLTRPGGNSEKTAVGTTQCTYFLLAAQMPGRLRRPFPGERAEPEFGPWPAPGGKKEGGMQLEGHAEGRERQVRQEGPPPTGRQERKRLQRRKNASNGPPGFARDAGHSRAARGGRPLREARARAAHRR